MRQEKFIEKYKHQIGGMILDGLTPREGAAKSVWVSQIMGKVEAVLAVIHGELTHQPPAEPPAKK